MLGRLFDKPAYGKMIDEKKLIIGGFMFEINSIPVFISVVEQGSFSKAAEVLGFSNSGVSKRISALEAQLGVKLLYRSTRKLSLTEAGERYYQHAQRAFEAAKEAESAATGLQQEAQGVLRISAPMSFSRSHIAPIIPKFLKAYPKISIQMELSDTWSDVISEGYDLALRAGDLPDSSLVAKPLAPLHSVICAAPNYLEEFGSPKEPADLVQHNCLLYSYHSTSNEWFFNRNDEDVRVEVKGNYQVNNSDALKEALLTGLGVGRLPSFIAGEEIKKGNLIPLLTDYQMPYKNLVALYPQRQYLAKKVSVFLSFLEEQFDQNLPYWDDWKRSSS